MHQNLLIIVISVVIRRIKYTSTQLLKGSFTGHAMLALLLAPMTAVVSITGGEKKGRVKLTLCKKRLKTCLWVKINPLQFKNATYVNIKKIGNDPSFICVRA